VREGVERWKLLVAEQPCCASATMRLKDVLEVVVEPADRLFQERTVRLM
jgi:hypothetical protein